MCVVGLIYHDHLPFPFEGFPIRFWHGDSGTTSEIFWFKYKKQLKSVYNSQRHRAIDIQRKNSALRTSSFYRFVKNWSKSRHSSSGALMIAHSAANDYIVHLLKMTDMFNYMWVRGLGVTWRHSKHNSRICIATLAVARLFIGLIVSYFAFFLLTNSILRHT